MTVTFVDEKNLGTGQYFSYMKLEELVEAPEKLTAILEIEDIARTKKLMRYISDEKKFKKRLENKVKKLGGKELKTFNVREVQKLVSIDGLPGKYCIKVYKKPEERLSVTTGATRSQLDKTLTWLPAADGDVRCYANNIWIVKKPPNMTERYIFYSRNYGVTFKPMLLNV